MILSKFDSFIYFIKECLPNDFQWFSKRISISFGRKLFAEILKASVFLLSTFANVSFPRIPFLCYTVNQKFQWIYELSPENLYTL